MKRYGFMILSFVAIFVSGYLGVLSKIAARHDRIDR